MNTNFYFTYSEVEAREGHDAVEEDTARNEEDGTYDFDLEERPQTSENQEPSLSNSSQQLCPACRQTFSHEANLKLHQELDCLYRNVDLLQARSNSKTPDRKKTVGVDDSDIEYWFSSDDACCIRRAAIAANGRARDYELIPQEEVGDVIRFLASESKSIEDLFNLFAEFIIRARLVLRAWFVKRDSATQRVIRREVLCVSSISASFVHDFHTWYAAHLGGISKNLNNLCCRDSDLEYDGMEALDIKINLLSKNLSAKGYFELPDHLKTKRAVVNVKTTTHCFEYSILSLKHYHDLTVSQRMYKCHYERWLGELKFGDIDAENVNIRDIPRIEKLNNCKINVHLYEKGLNGCIYNDLKNTAPTTYNILLVVNSQGERHYCGIPKLIRLYSHTTPSNNMQHMCERCCRRFSSHTLLDEHFQWCARGRLQIEKAPKETNFSYKNFHHELSHFKVIYADIESYIYDDIHKPAAIASYEVWHKHLTDRQRATKIESWQGEDCVVRFLSDLEEKVVSLHRHDNKMTRLAMLLTTEQEKEFNACENCPKCSIKFDTEKHKKVRDHCHITGKFRNALCNQCNLRLRLTRRTLHVAFHNFKNYDCHQIIKHGIDKFPHWQISIVPQTKEKYMTLRARIPVDQTRDGKPIYCSLVFLDSFQFMASSLATLASNLDNLPFTDVLKKDHPNISDEIIKRKGIFPYSYFDSFSRLQELSLPPRAVFRNDLSGEECTEEDYLFAQRAWQEFGCQNFGDYLMVYLKLDVLLLACVFEKFREKTLEQDGLDPVHFVSLPGLSFESAFKMSGERIELLDDLEMYTYFERGIRGGMTFTNTHRVRNERITQNGIQYMQHLAYIDENNLYGNALRKPLPHSEFCWVEDLSVFTRDFILCLDEEGEWGYTFEVDLGYPEHLHDATADFPLAPESGEIHSDMFSQFMKDFHSTLNPSKTYKPQRKLLLTQYNRHHYIVHFAILKFYLAMGLVLNKVHRVVKYKQKVWLKKYIDYNSEKRSKAKNEFEKSFYKLKNNALFGKTMEDVRKRINYKLVADPNKFEKLASSPLFVDRDIITENLTGVHMMKPKVMLNKPISVGQAVLDYSKLEMYKLFYEILLPCPLIKKLHLVGGDTDSFFLTIITDLHISLSDVYKFLAQHIDTSNYPPSHPLYSIVNKAKLGCFKDETAGQTVEEMILLRPKMYSMKYKNSDKAVKRAKGISRHIINNMRHERFVEAFEEKTTTFVQMTILRSKRHTIQTTAINKRALSAWEDKRVWVSENVSLPHGHKDSPVPLPKRRRVALPESGDVE